MSRSGQLDLRCTVELNCGGLSARLAGASITHDHTLDTCEPNYVPGAARHFLYSCGPQPAGGNGVCDSTGALLSGKRDRGHLAAPEPTSAGRRDPELRNTFQRRSSPLGEAEPGAMGQVVEPELTSAGRRGPELRNVWWRRSSTRQRGEVRGYGTRDGFGTHLCRDVWSEGTTYVTTRGCTHCYLS
jgi:hypothetical protein